MIKMSDLKLVLLNGDWIKVKLNQRYPCLDCNKQRRNRYNGFFYELSVNGEVHYTFLERDSALGKDYDRLCKTRKKHSYKLKKIKCRMFKIAKKRERKIII